MSKSDKRKKKDRDIQPKRPIVEVVELLNAKTSIKLTQPFVRVARVIFHIEFAINSLDFSKFGNDTALDPPLKLLYDEEVLLSVAALHDLSKYTYDVDVLSDDAATKIRTFFSRYTFSRYIPEGLDLEGNHVVEITKPDMSTTSNREASLVFQGWKYSRDA